MAGFEQLTSDPTRWRKTIEGITNPKAASQEEAILVRQWVAEALKTDSAVNIRYRLGEYALGADVVDFLWAFDKDHLRRQGETDEQARARRRRAYHSLLAGLLANYEFSAAHAVRDQLKESGETWWRRNRHFVLWRLLAGAVAGNVALGGSGTWLAVTKAVARESSWCIVLLVSGTLVVVPAVVSELFQAPPHVLADRGEFWRRLRSVVHNAAWFVLLITGAEWLVGLKYTAAGSMWRDGKVHLMMASVSLAIGYAVTLIWRERSIAGPA